MRAFLILLGILMFIGGCIATIVLPVFGMINGISEMVGEQQDQVSELAQAACDEGETGIQEALQERVPGGGVAISMRYFCEDEDGDRREVTDEVVTGLLTNPQELMSFLNVNPIFPAITLGGVLVFIFGLFYRPRREIPAVGMPIQMEASHGSSARSRSAPTVVVKTQTYDMSAGSSSFADLMKEVKSKAPTTDDDNLVMKVQQLEDARSKNLISQEEYDKMRKQILDSMK